MLRSRKVSIDKLEAATAEVMVQIPKERIPLLEEIYQIARQEERYERNELRTYKTFLFLSLLLCGGGGGLWVALGMNLEMLNHAISHQCFTSR